MGSEEQDESPAESGVSSVFDRETEVHDEALQEKDEEVIEDDSNYAAGLRLGLIVTGLTLSVLLVALVKLCPQSCWPILINASGPSNFSNRYSNHYHRFQFYSRRGMVWKRILNSHLCIAAHFWKAIPALLIEMDLSELPRPI